MMGGYVCCISDIIMSEVDRWKVLIDANVWFIKTAGRTCEQTCGQWVRIRAASEYVHIKEGINVTTIRR
jgi:hypothetical protein